MLFQALLCVITNDFIFPKDIIYPDVTTINISYEYVYPTIHCNESSIKFQLVFNGTDIIHEETLTPIRDYVFVDYEKQFEIKDLNDTQLIYYYPVVCNEHIFKYTESYKILYRPNFTMNYNHKDVFSRQLDKIEISGNLSDWDSTFITMSALINGKEAAKIEIEKNKSREMIPYNINIPLHLSNKGFNTLELIAVDSDNISFSKSFSFEVQDFSPPIVIVDDISDTYYRGETARVSTRFQREKGDKTVYIINYLCIIDDSNEWSYLRSEVDYFYNSEEKKFEFYFPIDRKYSYNRYHTITIVGMNAVTHESTFLTTKKFKVLEGTPRPSPTMTPIIPPTKTPLPTIHPTQSAIPNDSIKNNNAEKENLSESMIGDVTYTTFDSMKGHETEKKNNLSTSSFIIIVSISIMAVFFVLGIGLFIFRVSHVKDIEKEEINHENEEEINNEQNDEQKASKVPTPYIEVKDDNPYLYL